MNIMFGNHIYFAVYFSFIKCRSTTTTSSVTRVKGRVDSGSKPVLPQLTTQEAQHHLQETYEG